MKKSKNGAYFSKGLGIWASGMLIGASAVDLLPGGEPSWHPALRLAIGLLIGLVNLAWLYKATTSPTPADDDLG
ncbi:MAG: hypothetical protein HOM34_01505 [Planctomycetes bacterium]|jgi:divalent metal cation (Fe/Co/Zn/Cd) transporter|nr:hypothetical protein [Planctomycetota bacterium]MBT4029586.1 hypothetical protein [Planctomycetota bacterium]MBT4560544.1 hypothetical protein [Planctomycetota bacterium]MBT5101575.1 hypothetical protein [Planctomycetota bacterium]MBT5119378.1 hypothetical protein [Planctomycetota bacterium]